jgi:hypothetical protein
MLMSVALEVGDRATSDAHYVVRVCTEVVVSRPRNRPHLVVLKQLLIDEHAQLLCATKRGHAAIDM